MTELDGSSLDMMNENLEALKAIFPEAFTEDGVDFEVLRQLLGDAIDGQEKLYFVVETKSSNWWDDLRHKEGAKIECGEKHFKALAVEQNPAQYIKSTSVNDMMRHV